MHKNIYLGIIILLIIILVLLDKDFSVYLLLLPFLALLNNSQLITGGNSKKQIIKYKKEKDKIKYENKKEKDEKTRIKNIMLDNVKKSIDMYGDNYKFYRKNELNDKAIACMMCIIIINGKLTSYIYRDDIGMRKYAYIKLVEKAHAYKTLPDGKYYFYISDVFLYENEDFPVFLMAKPLNRKGILFPDDTLLNWEDDKKKITNNLYPENEVEDKIYFRGANTGADKHNIRDYLFKNAKESNFEISVGDKKKVEMYEFSKYKYLLNLPGHQPWSYRLKYLFLMHRLPIHLSVTTIYTKKEINSEWKTLIETAFDKYDYIEVKFNYYDSSYDKYKQLNEKGSYELNQMELYNLKKTFTDIQTYYNKNSNLYQNRIDRINKKINLIDETLIYDVIYKSFKLYNDKFGNYLKNFRD